MRRCRDVKEKKASHVNNTESEGVRGGSSRQLGV